MAASTASGPKGITAHAASAGIRVSMGAKMNRNLFAPVGTISSLNMSLIASAIGCSSPSGPTRLGPRRICIQPISFLSHKVRDATQARVARPRERWGAANDRIAEIDRDVGDSLQSLARGRGRIELQGDTVKAVG